MFTRRPAKFADDHGRVWPGDPLVLVHAPAHPLHGLLVAVVGTDPRLGLLSVRDPAHADKVFWIDPDSQINP